MSQLIPCAGCQRHVRNTERVCPFCDAALVPTAVRSLDPSTRLGRAALFAFRATTVAALSTLSACGDEQPSPPPTTVAPPEPHVILQPDPPPPPTTVIPPTSVVPTTDVPPATEVPEAPISDAHPPRPHHPHIGGPVPLYGSAMPAYGATPPFHE